jgi:hypothetical protein
MWLVEDRVQTHLWQFSVAVVSLGLVEQPI